MASGAEIEWEVERILDHCNRGVATKYLIKWKGYSHVYNSWEPLKHLKNCKEKIREYQTELKRPGRKRKAGSPPGEGDGERQWEIQLNIDRGHEAPIWIENSANPPEKFTYITQNLWGNNVPPTDESVIIGCHCHDNCDKSDTCCPRVLHGSDFPYTRDGLIQLELGQAIIECNVKCSCNKKCPNRVVQKGRKFEVVVFYTNNGKGWGLKSLVDIKAREFFSEYVGELVTSKEAEKREKLCDEAGMTYLLDLDFNEDKNAEFSIDAKQYGNASRFINHSCDPNLVAYGCWIDNPDPRLPRIALFACRDIPAGEELTLDYAMCSSTDTQCQHSQSNTPPPTPFNIQKSLQSHKKRVRCKCGSRNCRTYLF
ncbi:histone-lysine N-methyltransferase SUV39H1-like [Corticium candelabrum]|uniref:histone-lysine N-methyltransferase SUV39H1-like n=1 Tax=Corticium candelabrum TaxID=121492 RepID=UPI002E26ED38|nr:histone-lysine N-methyltransferase SUV39H1-like [Corticium candelabrum]